MSVADLEYLTTDEVAVILRTSGAGVRRLIRLGRLPAARVGRRWLIEPAAVRDLVTAGRVARDASEHVETSLHTT